MKSTPASARPSEPQGAAVDGTTRDRVLQFLLESGPMTAPELADALEITTVAVRRHLGILQDEGAISSRERQGQRGRGRPAREYVLTDAGRKEFGQAYDALAISALAELSNVLGTEAIDRIAEHRLQHVESEYLHRRDSEPDADPVELLAEVLTGSGYFASVQGAGDLCQHHCPISEVAAQFPELCEAETRVFSRLLGSHVSRIQTIADGDVACRTHVNPSLLDNPVRKVTHE